MLYIRNDSNDPYFNMAVEEYVIKNMDPSEEYFFLWQNSPVVVVGKNQNTIEEVNMDFVKENNIAVVRRLSGGGAVYHDLGNVNFTYVVDYRSEDLNSIGRFCTAVVKALEKMGIKAEFSGRNDITIDGKKISGNAQYLTKNRLLHHGTLLFDSDLEMLTKALNVKEQKISSKGIKSVKSRVTNIKEHLSKPVTVDEFKELVAKLIFEVEGSPFREYLFTAEDLANIRRLRDEKYSTWEWNFGQSPEFDLIRTKRFPGGEVEVRMNVKDGYIKGIKFFGDFMSMRDVTELEQRLQGKKYREQDVREVLGDINLSEYFGSISLDDLMTVIF